MSWNNYSSLHQVPATPGGIGATAAPPVAAAAAAIDDSIYGTLDLGHATQINDDLVRTIRDEIVNIDEGLQITAANVKNEERSFGQLTKNNNHSRDEMFKYRRDAAEILDSEIMTEDIRSGFKDQFRTEVAPHVVSPSSSSGHRGDHDDDDDGVLSTNGGDGNGGDPEGPSKKKKAFSHKKCIGRKRADLKSRTVSIHAIQQEIKATNKKIKATNEETASYVQDMNARQLDKVKMEGERQVEAKRRESEAEGQKNRGVKEAVQVARANSGAYAQKIAEKAKEQMEERGKHVEKESAMAKVNDMKKQELAILDAEERALDMELAALEGQLDFMSKQATEFESEQTKSSDMKVELEEVRRDIAELASSKEGKSKEAEASNAELRSALATFEEASKAVADAQAEKLENDKATTEVLEPTVARKADAIKEKEKLAGEVVELQKSIEQAQSSNKDAVASSETKVVAKSNELKDRKANLEKALADYEELQNSCTTAQEALASELVEHKDHATKFEVATKAEVDRLEQLKRERIDARVEHLEKRRADLGALEDAHRSDIDNLKQLHEYLREMKELKTKIDESEIILDECGEEMKAENDADGYDMNNEHGSPAKKRG